MSQLNTTRYLHTTCPISNEERGSLDDLSTC
nr:MAG TPA: hypothetical protein [Caudoviricetes sp.]